jgi:hypothetical protein
MNKGSERNPTIYNFDTAYANGALAPDPVQDLTVTGDLSDGGLRQQVPSKWKQKLHPEPPRRNCY